MSKLGCERGAKERCGSIHTMAKKGLYPRQAKQKQQSKNIIECLGQHLHLLGLIILFDSNISQWRMEKLKDLFEDNYTDVEEIWVKKTCNL